MLRGAHKAAHTLALRLAGGCPFRGSSWTRHPGIPCGRSAKHESNQLKPVTLETLERPCCTVFALLRAPLAGHYLHLQLTHIPRGLLKCASQAFHHLTTLSLGIPDDEIYTLDLPHPSTLPRLKTLHITGAITGTAEEETSMWDSVAPYIHQLTSLTVSEQWSMSDTPPPDPVRALWSVSSFWTGSPGLPLWATILHPNHPTHTLTHLDVHEELQPWLVQLLLLGAPELKELVCLSPEEWPYDTEMQGQCSWTRLGLRKWEGHVSLDVLACLPATADTLTIDLLSDDFGVKAYVAVTDEV